RADAIGVVEQAAELQPVVAHHTGVGCAAGGVFVDEVVDNLPEFRLQVQGVEGNIESIRNASSIGRIAGATATLLMIRPLLHHWEERGNRLTIERTGGDRLF